VRVELDSGQTAWRHRLEPERSQRHPATFLLSGDGQQPGKGHLLTGAIEDADIPKIGPGCLREHSSRADRNEKNGCPDGTAISWPVAKSCG
jgi:hypothetical protein